MNPVKIAIGFVPFVVFTLLTSWVPVGWAALAGLAAAIVLIVATARGGLKILPVVQAVILLGITVAGFVGGVGLDAFLVLYGRGLASLLLGLFIVVTAASMPFTAQFARAAVPPSQWHSPAFVQVNRRLSLAWGAVVLVLGTAHVAGAVLAAQEAGPLVRLLVEWGLPILALLRVVAYTRRIVAQNAPSA